MGQKEAEKFIQNLAGKLQHKFNEVYLNKTALIY
jgi:hypothetical protein